MEKKSRIMIIDDEPNILFTISEICTYCGYEPITAEDGETGFYMIRQSPPDLVIVDYNMPGWDGVKTVKMIRAHGYTMPILVLTVDEQQETADKFLAAGATDFSIKPIKAPDLIARMKINLKVKSIEGEMQRKKEERYIESGISLVTLQKIATFLQDQDAALTYEEISTGVNLAYKTVHRYIQYLLKMGFVEVVSVYGHLGRPKNRYRLKSDVQLEDL